MKERPILFSAPMIRALLAGTKTQTRRLIKAPHIEDAAAWRDDGGGKWSSGIAADYGRLGYGETIRCPHGVPGDRLWVRETWGIQHEQGLDVSFSDQMKDARSGMPWAAAVYRATETHYSGPWKPSIHMPRWASRITLEVTSVRVEQLQDITEADARAEGVVAAPFCKAGRPDGLEHVEAFEGLWDEINGKRAPWAGNPWVWVVEFRRLEAERPAA